MSIIRSRFLEGGTYMKLRTLVFTSLLSVLAITSCGGDAPQDPNLDYIAVTHLPSKTEYVIGEEFDASGLEVTAFYDDSTYKVVSDYSLSGFDSSVVRESLPITVTYKEKTTSFTVKIKDDVRDYSIQYLVNNSQDLSALDLVNSTLPSSAKNGATVSIKVSVKEEYDYTGFFVTGPNVDDSFYDQFEEYDLTESEFSFVMPKSNLTVYLGAREHGEKYNATFASVEHARFEYSGTSKESNYPGTTVEFIVVIDDGYELSGLPFIVGDSSITISKNKNDVYSFTMPSKNVSISATIVERQADTYKCTLDNVAHVTLSKHYSVEDLDHLVENQVVVIVVTPEAGYELDGKPFIVGDASIIVTKSDTAQNGWVFVMPAKDITFSVNVKSSSTTKYTVSFANVAHATMNFSGTSESQYAPGSSVKFYIRVDEGYQLVGTPFLVNDSTPVSQVSGTVYSFVMPEKDVAISANVTEVASETYKLTIDDVSNAYIAEATGSLDLNNVQTGSLVTIIVSPNSGYKLNGLPFIVEDSSIVVSINPDVSNGYRFTMPAKDVTFSASITALGKYTVTFAEVQYVTFTKHAASENPCTAEDPFMFTIATVDGVTAGTPYVVEDSSIKISKDSFGVYFFTMPEMNITITVTTSGAPKVLDHISVQGTPKTEYKLNETLEPPTVYAFYSIGGGTPSEYEEVPASKLTFSGYNMAIEGEYTVTISYTKSGVTKTTSYNITVSGSVPATSVVTNTPYECNIYGTSGNVVQKYRFVFGDDGTGYYERVYYTQAVGPYVVHFTYTIVENILKATFSSYDTDVNMSKFANGYRIFADGYLDYQSINISLYQGSVAANLLTVTYEAGAQVVKKATTPTVFNLATA